MAKRIGDVARAAGVGVETVRFYANVRFVRKIAPDLALVDADWRIEGAKSADCSARPAETGILVAVLRERGEHWSILALRENEGAGAIQTFAVR